MKHIVIGTAGHIDHGKTTLIKALTGRETDTLVEEKKRGISINLGFTFFDLPSQRRAGIIDVPGHEKFVKNMLAGISGIDIVLLVIAADEGIMPQTKEHFEILQLLNVKRGIIVLTKADLVDEDWLGMMKEEIKDNFKGTFLENSPMYSVSSKSGMGIKELIEEIDKMTEEIDSKDTAGHFRLPVDRSFSVSGFGTVVTGTIISGKIKVGDTVEIYPNRVKTKVRSIQIHGESSEIGEAGQRCAVNLANIKVEEVGRGDVISEVDIMEPSMMIDCNLYYLKSMKKPLVNRQRVRLYHGTQEILCRVVLLDKEELQPGESAYVQLRLEEYINCQRNDRFVIRSYSPMFTIGGGIIVDPNPNKAKRFKDDYLDELKIKEEGKTESILENTIFKLSEGYANLRDIVKALGRNEEDIEEKLEQLQKENKIIKLQALNEAIYIHEDFLQNRVEEMNKILGEFHKANPLKVGIVKEELKNKVFGKQLKQKNYDEILEILNGRKECKIQGKYVSDYEFEISLSSGHQKIKDDTLKAFKDAMFNPPKYKDLEDKQRDKKAFKMVFDLLLDSEDLVKCAEDICFHKENYEKAKETVVEFIKKNGSLTAAQGREILETNRKYAVAILENFDSIKLTKRLENERVLY